MKPQAFLETAWALLERDEEADHRSAASRAYYAVFHACKPLVKQLPPATNKQGKPFYNEHLLIQHTLKKCVQIPGIVYNSVLIEEIQVVGSDVSDIRTLRNSADYDINDPFSRTIAQHIVTQSACILERVTAILIRIDKARAASPENNV